MLSSQQNINKALIKNMHWEQMVYFSIFLVYKCKAGPTVPVSILIVMAIRKHLSVACLCPCLCLCWRLRFHHHMPPISSLLPRLAARRTHWQTANSYFQITNNPDHPHAAGSRRQLLATFGFLPGPWLRCWRWRRVRQLKMRRARLSCRLLVAVVAKYIHTDTHTHT